MLSKILKTLSESIPNLFTTRHANEATESTSREDTYVHVWNLTSRGVGHTALQVGEGDTKEYISIHPGIVPAIGPLALLPLPGAVADTLQEDMVAEAESQQSVAQNAGMDSMDMPRMRLGQAPLPESIPPSRTITLRDLDTQAIRHEISKVRREVESGQTGYQLLPKVNALGFFNDLSTFINQDPVDIELARRQGTIGTPSKAFNCATLVSHLLVTGGATPIQDSALPWEPTPNDIERYASGLTR